MSADEEPTETQPREIDPTFFTLGVEVGDEQGYTITKAFQLLPNGSNRSEYHISMVGEFVQEGEKLVVRVSVITSSRISYDVFTKLQNGSLVHLSTYTISRTHRIFEVQRFITTTNQTVLEHKLEKFSPKVFQYDFFDTKLNLTRKGWDLALKCDIEHIFLYDLHSGWLLYNYCRAWNSTHILLEHEIRIDNWSSFWITLTSTNLFFPYFWALLIVPILSYIRRRQKRM